VSLIKKFKIFVMCIIVVCISYSMVSLSNLDAVNTNNDKSAKANKDKNSQSDSSIFSVNFIDPQKIKDALLNNGINYLRRISESGNLNSLNDKHNVKLNNPNINFDEAVVSVYIESQNSNESSPGNSLVINDGFYIKNNLTATESVNGNVETVFITDNATNQLISCRENNGSYKCHTAVSNLNNPQDILVINSYIYIVNSHKDGESGDVTRCNVTNQGYIDSCGQTKINIINPIFFYYNPPNVNISGFEYSSSGRRTPLQAIQCSMDARGNFINCNPDYDTLSAFYISKYYNGNYYRTHSSPPNSYIEKCVPVDAIECINLPNGQLVSPLSLSINHDRIFVSNAKPPNTTKPDILKCSLDMKNCDVITNDVTSPMCIGVFNFKRTSDGN